MEGLSAPDEQLQQLGGRTSGSSVRTDLITEYYKLSRHRSRSMPRRECHVGVSQDGRAIVSGWEDGRVRAHAPQSRKELWTLVDAHQGAVTSLAVTSDCKRLVTGGTDGAVRVWELGPSSRTLLASMKEHRVPHPPRPPAPFFLFFFASFHIRELAFPAFSFLLTCDELACCISQQVCCPSFPPPPNVVPSASCLCLNWPPGLSIRLSALGGHLPVPPENFVMVAASISRDGM